MKSWVVQVLFLASLTALACANVGRPIHHYVENAEARNSVCIDGTPAVYYLSTNVESDSWLIYMQGGGLCTSEADCLARSKTALGSSKDYKKTMDLGGIFARSNWRNREFHLFNQVFIPYCSGDLYSGNGTYPTTDTVMNFRGRDIIKAVFEDLQNGNLNNHPLKKKDNNIVLAGGSAGGVGVIVHLDLIREQFPDNRVYGIVDGGWFVEVAPFNPTSGLSPSDLIKPGMAIWNGNGPAACHTDPAIPADEKWRCYLGETVGKYLSASEYFVFQAQYDIWQLWISAAKLPELSKDPALKAYATDVLAPASRASFVNATSASVLSPKCFAHAVLTTSLFRLIRVEKESTRSILHRIYKEEDPSEPFPQRELHIADCSDSLYCESRCQGDSVSAVLLNILYGIVIFAFLSASLGIVFNWRKKRHIRRHHQLLSSPAAQELKL